MIESENTGVIYMITNNVNNKKYIGKAYSYEKHGIKSPTYYSAQGRFKRHKTNAQKNSNEIPLLYNDMRLHGKDNFSVTTLEVCLKENLSERERHYIQFHNTCDNNIGYNFLVGSKKPIDNLHKENYEINKVQSNKARAIGGNLKQSDETKLLPPNIYKRSNGYFVQIKISGILHSKAFLSSKDSDEIKLSKANLWLNHVKSTNIDV